MHDSPTGNKIRCTSYNADGTVAGTSVYEYGEDESYTVTYYDAPGLSGKQLNMDLPPMSTSMN